MKLPPNVYSEARREGRKIIGVLGPSLSVAKLVEDRAGLPKEMISCALDLQKMLSAPEDAVL